MMRVGGWALLAMLVAVPAVAQDTAPDMAPDMAVQTDATRPPERPATDDQQPADPQPDEPQSTDDQTDPDPQPSDSRAPDPDAADPSAPDPNAADAAPAEQDPRPFGPPPPPVWFTLAETDAQYDTCRLALSVMGAQFRPQAPVTDPENRDCGIARPVQVTQILPGIPLSGQPVMRCDTALSLALLTRDFLQPAAALLPDQPRLTGLETGPAYSCRERVGTGEADPKPSEHGYGNAIDVMGFRFDDGDPVLVQPRQGDGDPLESFQKAAQGAACLLFTTVLGPGSNAAHDDHLHLDMTARNGGWRLCE